MATLTPQAEKLNKIIERESSLVFGMFSGRGKQIYFPHEGILGQSAEAKGRKYNATIGMACEDDGTIMALEAMTGKVLVNKDSIFPYASSFGKKELRERWHELLEVKNEGLRKKNVSVPVVTCALTHGLSVVGYLFADPETEVVLAEPLWGNYKLVFGTTYGAKLVTFPLFKAGGFNVEGLREKLAGGAKRKILLLNFPNNPTGYTPTNGEVDALIQVIREHAEKNKIIVVTDDAYFGLVYQEGVFKHSLFTRLYDLHENVLGVKIDGITKEDYAWGLRVGFISFGCRGGTKALYTSLEDKAAGAVRATVSNAPNLSQALVLEALNAKGYDEQKLRKRKLLESRFKKIQDILAHHGEYREYFGQLPCNSGYFMCVQLASGLDAEAVRKHLLTKYDTGLISVGSTLRVAFSSVPASQLEVIFDSIYRACKDLKG
ncbi:MAG: aminotransferase class I/II-fold pyridoxal phosphate-dependent enzyme [Patescibacteria group bacterium]